MVHDNKWGKKGSEGPARPHGKRGDKKTRANLRVRRNRHNFGKKRFFRHECGPSPRNEEERRVHLMDPKAPAKRKKDREHNKRAGTCPSRSDKRNAEPRDASNEQSGSANEEKECPPKVKESNGLPRTKKGKKS